MCVQLSCRRLGSSVQTSAWGEKRAESCEPRRSVHQQGRPDMLHWAKPGALAEVFYFHVSVLRIRLRQIWYDQTGQTFPHGLGSNRDRSKQHSLDQTLIYTDQTQPVEAVTGDSSSTFFSNYRVQNEQWEGTATWFKLDCMNGRGDVKSNQLQSWMAIITFHHCNFICDV